MLGRVKGIRVAEGFGFITGNDGKDRFFHCSQLFGIDISELRAGQAVTFDEGQDRGRGPRASNVWTYPVVDDKA